MAKITLTDLANLQNETTAVNAINANNAVLETAMEKTLSRDGTSPNQMTTLLDMNNNQIINLPAPSNVTSPIRVQDAIAGISTVTAATGTSGHTVPFLDGNNIWSGSNSFPTTVMKEKLVVPRAYYVRTDGNNANTGLTNTAGGAFQTINFAVTYISRNIDASGQVVTVQVANGTYFESVDFSTPVVGAGCSGQLVMRGDPTTPSNVIISGADFGFRVLGPGPDWVVKGFKIVTSTGPALWSHANGWMRFQDVEIGTCGGPNGVMIQADHRGNLELQGACTVTAPAGFFAVANSGGYILGASGLVTLVGTPAFSNYFVYASDGSRIRWVGPTFSGSATGARYYSDLNSVIVSSTGSATFFPGSSAGTTATGGIYA